MRSFVLPAGLPSRFAVAVTKKVGSTAVLRNRIKRLVYHAIEEASVDILAGQPCCMVIFGVKKDISELDSALITKEIKNLLYLSK